LSRGDDIGVTPWCRHCRECRLDHCVCQFISHA
jgi:hypothetical protein